VKSSPSKKALSESKGSAEEMQGPRKGELVLVLETREKRGQEGKGTAIDRGRPQAGFSGDSGGRGMVRALDTIERRIFSLRDKTKKGKAPK